MKDLLVALVQVNVTVGALMPNAAKVVRLAKEAADEGASVIVFPELALCGYPPEDLVLKEHFLRDAEDQLERLARELPPEAVVIVGAPRPGRAKAFNSAAVFAGGQLAACYHKMALPNYGVFDEQRVFAPGDRPMVLQIGDLRLGLHICEDSWAHEEPACASLATAGLSALINLSASPYHRGKLHQREEVLKKTAAMAKAPLLYCNLVGGQDELVFDGASLALSADGEILARARQFADDVLYVRLPVAPASPAASGPFEVVNLPRLGKTGEKVSNHLSAEALAKADWKNVVASALDDLAEVYSALKLGLRDYVDKNGFSRVVVALSGGIDSALVATLAVDALGKDRVAGITMPSQYSSKETRADAEVLAGNLGIEFHKAPIKPLYDAYIAELEPLWRGRHADVTEENLQARIRANVIMALSNKFGWLVLTTGNKSEIATGYCTLYGDMVGGFGVIKDVPKTLVFELANWRNRQAPAPVIPPSTITRAPSAELRPDQKDSDTLPPYEVLDPILERYIERNWGADRIAKEGHDAATVRRVIRLVDRSEYKRRQGAPGIKITPLAFGRDRRMPITNLYGEHGPSPKAQA